MFASQELQTLINLLSIKQLGLNWVDFVIVLVFFFYGIEGFAVGFIVAFFDLLSFALSFVVALKFYSLFGELLVENFSMPLGFANALGFFIAAMLSEIVFNLLFRVLFKKMAKFFPDVDRSSPNMPLAYLASANKLLGFLPGIASSVILLSFLLTVIISLPFSPFLKQAVSESKLGNPLVAKTQGVEKKLNEVFGGAVNDTLNFLTVKPQSEEFVKLNFKTTAVSVDETSERTMVLMLSRERTKRGLTPLVVDEKLRELARAYSKDMFARGYFSHYTPEGTSPFDRMAASDIVFEYAGENLALAPNTELAMQGLMQSPGHRANMLNENFRKVGIGVMDGGIYGKMFTQEFTD